jgi:hypothetical protein
VEAFEPNIRALMVFAAAWSVCCAGVFYLAGMLPLSGAPAALRSASGNLLILLDAVLLFGLFALTMIFSYRELRWSSAVVVGGAIFLFSPFLTQDLPDAFRNGKPGLLALFLLLVAAFGLLLASGAQHFPVNALT